MFKTDPGDRGLQQLKRQRVLLSYFASIFPLFGLLLAAGWVTHVIYLIQYFTSDQVETVKYVAFLIIGMLIAPVGAIHGIGSWFGIW